MLSADSIRKPNKKQKKIEKCLVLILNENQRIKTRELKQNIETKKSKQQKSQQKNRNKRVENKRIETKETIQNNRNKRI